MGASGADSLAGRFTFVAAKIVEDDDFTRCEGGCQHLLDVQREQLAIDGAVNDPGRADPIVAQRCNEGHGLPMAEGRSCDETLATWPPNGAMLVLIHVSSIKTRLHQRDLITHGGFTHKTKHYNRQRRIAREAQAHYYFE